LAFCTSFSENCLFSSCVHLLIGLSAVLIFHFFEFFVYSVDQSPVG
jgi:hypothetical protein